MVLQRGRRRSMKRGCRKGHPNMPALLARPEPLPACSLQGQAQAEATPTPTKPRPPKRPHPLGQSHAPKAQSGHSCPYRVTRTQQATPHSNISHAPHCSLAILALIWSLGHRKPRPHHQKPRLSNKATPPHSSLATLSLIWSLGRRKPRPHPQKSHPQAKPRPHTAVWPLLPLYGH